MIRLTPYGVTNDRRPSPFTHTNSFRMGLLSFLFGWF